MSGTGAGVSGAGAGVNATGTREPTAAIEIDIEVD